MTKIINLATTEKYIKFNIVKDAGYEVNTEGRKIVLIDKKSKNNDCGFENTFYNIDEAIILLADRLHYRVVMA